MIRFKKITDELSATEPYKANDKGVIMIIFSGKIPYPFLMAIIGLPVYIGMRYLYKIYYPQNKYVTEARWCMARIDEATKPMQKAKEILCLSASEIDTKTPAAINTLAEQVQKIIAVPANERTFANTFGALDYINALSDFTELMSAVQVLEVVSPDEQIRTAAQKSFIQLQQAHIDLVSNNQPLYIALKAYSEHITEPLTAEQRYFIKETLQELKRAGLELPEKERLRVAHIKKEIAQLSSQFQQNILADQSHIIVAKEALDGLDASFIDQLKRTDDGMYIVGVDYPTFFAVRQQCTVAQTRKGLYRAFVKRAYPSNEAVLQEIITKRAELAQLLGYATFTDFDLNDQMVQSRDRAEDFLDQLLHTIAPKTAHEVATICASLPTSVELTPDGKLYPWDTEFVIEQYKKKQFQLDDQLVAHYFPVEHTIDGLLAIYESFFNLTFRKVSVPFAWHSDVQGLLVYEKSHDCPIGFLLLDLYPRPFKYPHACQASVIPATYDHNGDATTALAVVIANFPKPQPDKPALLPLKDIRTFFHEFGHALHTILGRTTIACLSGTNVKRDFVEMPSQMLEEWLYDADILRNLSCHYQTGQPLPQSLIDAIIATKNLTTGITTQTQIFYARTALTLFGTAQTIPLQDRLRTLFEDTVSYTTFDAANHMYANFGHLTDYGAKYYGYLWSKVFALDLFYEIKKHGLLNAEIGTKYRTTILAKGGSKDPNQLLHDFLGRAPNQAAFLADLGV